MEEKFDFVTENPILRKKIPLNEINFVKEIKAVLRGAAAFIFDWPLHWHHNEDQITGNSTVCLTVCFENITARVTGYLEGEPSVNSGFPLQKANNAETVSFDDVIMRVDDLQE